MLVEKEAKRQAREQQEKAKEEEKKAKEEEKVKKERVCNLEKDAIEVLTSGSPS